MPFQSDPSKPGSDAWAMLDAEGAHLLGPRFVELREQMLELRRWTAATWGSRGYVPGPNVDPDHDVWSP